MFVQSLRSVSKQCRRAAKPQMLHPPIAGPISFSSCTLTSERFNLRSKMNSKSTKEFEIIEFVVEQICSYYAWNTRRSPSSTLASFVQSLGFGH